MNRTVFRGLFAVAVCCQAVASVAQEEPNAPPAEARAAIIVRAESDDGGVGVQSFEFATSDGGDFMAFAPAMEGQAFSIGMVGNPLEASEFLLRDPSVQQELELLDHQKEQLQKLNQEFAGEIRTKLDGLMNANPADREKIHETIREMSERKKSRLAEVLLPHQVERLTQISLQSNINQAGLAHALASKALMEKLGIDEDQKEALNKKAAELRQEFDEKVAKLKNEMRDELINELNPEQRKQLKELLGENYEFPTGGPMVPGPRFMRGGRATTSDEGN
jgi:hypothetical protein